MAKFLRKQQIFGLRLRVFQIIQRRGKIRRIGGIRGETFERTGRTTPGAGEVGYRRDV